MSKNVQKCPSGPKKLCSQFGKYFFDDETINFNYGLSDSFLHKMFWFSENGQKKCPKSKSQNTFAFRKTWFFL
jgi:hypothetical protein